MNAPTYTRTVTIYDRTKPEAGRATITAEITPTDRGPELSMHGTISDGGRSFGQCIDSIREKFGHITPAAALLDLWQAHHLNGLRPGCTHQPQTEYGPGKHKALALADATPAQLAALERERDERHAATIKRALAEYLNTTSAARMAHDAAAVDGRPATSEDYEAAEALTRRTPAELADIATGKKRGPYHGLIIRPGSGQGPISRTRALALAILEHIHTTNPPPALPELSTYMDSISYPCPTCGYQYGHAWNYEPLPTDIQQTIDRLMDEAEAGHAGDTTPPPGPRTLAERVTEYGLTLDIERVSQRPDHDPADEWTKTARHWHYTITRAGSTAPALEGYYSQGSAHTETPTAADILGSLLLDVWNIAGQTFEDWCQEYGYDTDSRKAERMFKACQQTGADLARMFSPAELAALLDPEQTEQE